MHLYLTTINLSKSITTPVTQPFFFLILQEGRIPYIPRYSNAFNVVLKQLVNPDHMGRWSSARLLAQSFLKRKKKTTSATQASLPKWETESASSAASSSQVRPAFQTLVQFSPI